MPWLSSQLTLPVPQPFVVKVEPLVVRHELVRGEPIEQLDQAAGSALGTFLRSLHDVSVTDAMAHGLPSAEVALGERGSTLSRFEEAVVPLLPIQVQGRGRDLLATLTHAPADTVVHGDLGPEHVLCIANDVSGVIDFGDVHVGDPALDLSWALCGTPSEFAGAVAESYGVTAELRRRALLWHQLGPWYEVIYGRDENVAAHIESGLEGVLRRL